jgi:D-alanyl-D-alanine carboxypeptidase
VNKLIAILLTIVTSASCRKGDVNGQAIITGNVVVNKNYHRGDSLQKLARQYAASGIPGIVIGLYTKQEGYWGTAAGFSEVETKTPMQLSNLQYLQSVTKTYLAAALLKLQEEGKINIDATITKYLPERYAGYIDNASSMTVRNLLNHTSGMPDYLENPEYIAYAMEHPGHIFSSEEFLSYIKNTKQLFPAGSRFRYCNTNYHVLALIADSIYGSHDELMRQKIIIPLQLQHTFYRDIAGKTDLVKNYLDLRGTGEIQNVTELQQSSIIGAKGDDGMVSTPFDAVNFLRYIVEGKLLSSASLNEMTHWVNGDDGNAIYGMGLYHVLYNGKTGLGHGGAGAGAGCALYYFPSENSYIFLGTNIGTLVDGPLVQKVAELKAKILQIVLNN